MVHAVDRLNLPRDEITLSTVSLGSCPSLFSSFFVISILLCVSLVIFSFYLRTILLYCSSFFFPMILFFFVRIISGMHSKKLLLGFSYLICTTSLSLSLSFHVGVLAYIKFFACVSACCTHYVIYFHFDL